ncbi:15847_t:CDS:10, partial [Entrophospora sp. SA101]
TFAWSPGQNSPIIATGTVAGALDASFSNTTELELFHLNLDQNDSSFNLQQPSGLVTSNARFDRLAWGIAADKPYGIIAGGMENGELDLWDPSIILEGGDSEKALILRNNAHTGNVRGLAFNNFQSNLLASGATNGEVFIWDLTKPDKPYTPGTRSKYLEEISHLAWNNQVQHILATSSNTGCTVVWDLKFKREVTTLSYSVPDSAVGLSGGVGRRGATAVAWNPDLATQIIVASEDDNNPVIVVWDLRNARAPEKILVGHQRGVLSLSWCKKDSDLLLSCGKDNRTLCWNPRTLEILGELPPSSNWYFDVQFCPTNPDLLATASFDGKISVHSLQSGRNQNETYSIDSNDPFSQIARDNEPSLTLKLPPKWLRRPIGVSFGFGGKLISFNNKTATKKGVVAISNIVSEPEVAKSSDELENSVEAKTLDVFCEKREKQATSEFESENWRILYTMFNENENARELLVKNLGFSKEDIVAKISDALKAMNLKDHTESDIIDYNKKQKNVNDNDKASKFFSPDVINSDPFPITNTDDPTSILAVTSSSPIPKNLGAFKIYPTQESDVDKLITRSIVLGDFESAVKLCLEADRLSDALILAGCGGPELLQHTRKIYFEKHASTIPYLRLLQSIVSGDLSDIVLNADLSEWQEVVVVLCTFARSEEFGGLCNALGQRLEKEYHKLTNYSATNEMKAQGSEYRRNAVLCYLAAGNLENVVNIWIAEQEEEEQSLLEKATQNLSSSSELPSPSSKFFYHAKSLQSLIEKVTVFRKAIDYVDSDLIQNLDGSVDLNQQQPHRHYKLAPLYDKYTEYAEILISQGRLTTALKYLNLTPIDYKKSNINKIDSLAVVRDRLYKSGVDVGGTKAPPFPFEEKHVVGEAAQQPYFNQYNYNQQPVAPNVPPYQQTQQTPYNNNPYAPQYNSPIQNQTNTGYPYQQPVYPAYNQPQYQDSATTTTNTSFIPPPPQPFANPNVQNQNSPTDITPAANKKNLANWNDPPVVPSSQLAKKTNQTQVNKLTPITTPFQNQNTFVPQGMRQQHQYQQEQQQQQKFAPPSSKPSPLLNDSISGITIKVIGSNKKINDKGKAVLAFVIIVGKSKVVDGKIVDMEKELWRIEKLYSDFLGLDSKLKQKQHKSVTQKIGKLPDKTLFSNNAPSKVDQRKLALEQYLLHVISLNLSDSKDLYDFLSSNLPGRKEGYLTKKGKSFGGWKSRYFVLNSPLLEYYESKEGSQLGFIRLTNAQIGRQSNANSESDKDGENSYRHAFLILEPKLLSSRNTHTRHVLCAESDSERDAWLEALLQYVGVNEEEATEKSKKKKSKLKGSHHHQKKPSLSSSQFNNDQIDPSKNIHPSNQQHYPPHRQQSHPSSQQSHFTPHHQQSHPPPHHQQSHPPPHHQQSQPPLQYQQSQHFQTQTSPSLLGVSGSNKMNSRHSFTPPRDELEKNSAPEPRDISPLGNNNNNNQTTYLNGQPNLRKGQNDEHKKAARKTFFGTMFGIKEDKKKNQDQKPDVHKVVFGVPLDQAIAVSRIKEGYELPAVLYRCIEYLDAKDAAEEEGIYRLSGANATIKMLKDRFNTEGDVNLLGEEEYYDVHAVAGLLKLYLRELPTSVLTRDLHLEFVHVIERINELGRLVSTLPLSNYTLLRTLTGHLIRIVQNAAVNKMTARNIGIVFSPTLGIPASVFSLFMAEFDYIFFTDSDGIAAPRTMDVPSEAPDNSKNSPDTKNPPISLSPVTAIRRRDIRDEITGRNNRNSVHYMDSAPEKVVGLERKMTVTKPTQKDDTSDEEVVNDLAIQAEQDDDASSIDELTTQSAPISPRLPVARYPKTNSIPTSTSLNNDSTESNGLLDTGDLRKMRRLTVRNFTEGNSIYEEFAENQKMIENEKINSSTETVKSPFTSQL